MIPRVDISGQRFGRLVVGRHETSTGKKSHWRCVCDCGQTTFAKAAILRRGHKRSCGCLQRDVTSKRARTHGLSGTPEHQSWMKMLGRCGNPNNKNYHQYGGRGVEVRYLSFSEFLSDVGARPGPGYSVDRINVNGHYEAGNCRWADKATQGENRRTTLLVTHAGETKTLAAWGRELGIKPQTLYCRMFSYGWSTDRALSAPAKPHGDRSAARKKFSMSELAAMALCAVITRYGEPLIPDDIKAKGKKAILSHVEWDHIIPLALGGLDHFSNMQPLTREDHKAKTRRDMRNIARARRLTKKQEIRALEIEASNEMPAKRKKQKRAWPSRKMPKGPTFKQQRERRNGSRRA